jgi:hypothetical protein
VRYLCAIFRGGPLRGGSWRRSDGAKGTCLHAVVGHVFTPLSGAWSPIGVEPEPT